MNSINKYQGVVVNGRLLLPSIVDERKMVEESIKAEVLAKLYDNLKYIDFANMQGARNSYQDLNLSRNDSPLRKKSTYAVYPSILQKVQWSTHKTCKDSEEVDTGMDKKHVCHCRNCRSKKCLAKQEKDNDTSKPKQNTVTFSHAETNTLDMEDVCCGSQTPLEPSPVCSTENVPSCCCRHKPPPKCPSPKPAKNCGEEDTCHYNIPKPCLPEPPCAIPRRILVSDSILDCCEDPNSLNSPDTHKSSSFRRFFNLGKLSRSSSRKTLYNEGISSKKLAKLPEPAVRLSRSPCIQMESPPRSPPCSRPPSPSSPYRSQSPGRPIPNCRPTPLCKPPKFCNPPPPCSPPLPCRPPSPCRPPPPCRSPSPCRPPPSCRSPSPCRPPPSCRPPSPCRAPPSCIGQAPCRPPQCRMSPTCRTPSPCRAPPCVTPAPCKPSRVPSPCRPTVPCSLPLSCSPSPCRLRSPEPSEVAIPFSHRHSSRYHRQCMEDGSFILNSQAEYDDSPCRYSRVKPKRMLKSEKDIRCFR